jgi:hypothetical protein
MTTERLEWELEVAIPQELKNTTNARRKGRLQRDRTAIEAELQRRLEAATGERMDLL